MEIVFSSGCRGQVWAKYRPEVKKLLADYDAKKVAKYSKKDVERLLQNPKMFKNRRKVEAVVYNAKQIVKISKQYNGFWRFLDSHSQNIPELVEKVKSNFKFFHTPNAYALLKYVGMEVMKPDINIVRILYRFGLLESDKKNDETFKHVQEIGRKMAEASGGNLYYWCERSPNLFGLCCFFGVLFSYTVKSESAAQQPL